MEKNTERMYINPDHCTVQRKSIQHCRSATLELKKKEKKIPYINKTEANSLGKK